MKHPSAPAMTGPLAILILTMALAARPASAQLTDVTQTPNTVGAGIQKSFVQQVGPGRGNWVTPESSSFLIARDPFRSIVRGRQIFQRKFTDSQGLGPRLQDGIGNIAAHPGVGAGLADSCAACHSRPFGSAGFGGNVFTRPDSRDAPHLFGLGLKEMLADEITQELRAIRKRALAQAQQLGVSVTWPLTAKGIQYGAIIAHSDGSVDTSLVEGVDADLRVRPFFAEGRTISIREFSVGAFKAEMGLEGFDVDLARASNGHDILTPSGMRLNGTTDAIEPPPVLSPHEDGDLDGVVDEVPTSSIDHLEFYLLNYFTPGNGRQTPQTASGLATMGTIGCLECHVKDLTVQRDRRVADVETVYDPPQANGVFSMLHGTATPLYTAIDDGSGWPYLRLPTMNPFVVQGFFSDLKRHDLGPAFHERRFDGTVATQFMTTPLWGVGSTPPYGHDGRSMTLEDVIAWHGGEARFVRDAFLQLGETQRQEVIAFLTSLVLFSPPDTPSNLEPANLGHPQFPLVAHGSINLSVLFNDPNDRE